MSEKHIGKVIQVIGPVLDIQFKDGELPELLNAIEIDNHGQKLVVEVAQLTGDNVARCIAMSSTDGLVRGTEAVDTGRADDVQDEVKRLRTAGKEDGSIKTKITAAVKEEYLAGNDHDREKLEKLLTSLTKEDGTAMYEEKNFAQWVKDAATGKKQQG